MELRAGYKLTDVGLIPNDWLTYTVRDLIELLTDYDANGSFESVAVNVKTYDYEEFAWYVRSTDLENNASLNKVKYVDEPSYKFLKKTSLYGGELLFLKRGDIGNVYLFEMKTERATVAPNLYLLKLNQISNSKYLYYYFVSQSGQKQLKSKNASSTLGALYKDDVKSIIVPLPPTKSEQTAIATSLSDADALISSLEKLIAKKRNIKQGAMQKLLQPKEGWEVKKLGELLGKVTTGKLDANAMKENGEYRFYTCAKDYSFIDDFAFDTEALLVSGNGANVGYIHYYKGKFNAYQRTYVLTDFKIDIFYIKLYLDSYLKDRITTEVSAGNTPYIKMDTITDMVINFPSNSEEQKNISIILFDMEEEIQSLETKLEKYKKVKLGMMQNLLTGKIRLV